MTRPSNRSPLMLPPLDGSRSRRWGLAIAIALGAHGALGFGLSRAKPEPTLPAIVTELDLEPPPALPVATTPDPGPEPPPDPAPAPTGAVRRARWVERAAPAARAGKLLVAKQDAPSPPNAAPVDFVTDPAGASYHGGVVARGGTGGDGSHGTAVGPVPSAPAGPSAPPRRSKATPAADLRRPPALTNGSGCRGYYPRSADADSAVAIVVVAIDESGAVTGVTLTSESPAGQGFGQAARACMRASRFRPGLDKAGHAVKAMTTVRVRFTR